MAILLWSGCSKPRPDNVIIILVDTLRADHLGCYGYARPTSPNIDELARQSFVAENAIAQAPWTLPSVASLFTSLYPLAHGATMAAHAVPECLDTLAEVLKRHDFETAAFSTNVVFVSARTGLHQGFDLFQVLSRPAPGAKPGDLEIDETATTVTNRAIEWIKQRSGKRFFLYLHYMDPHSDYAAPPAYREQFERPYSGRFDGTTVQLMAALVGKIPIEEPDIRHLINLYDAEIAYVDAEIGRLLEVLQESGLSDTTMVVLLSDHGEEFHDHGKVLHDFSLHRELLRVPLILRIPASSGGRRLTEIVQVIDVGPTILDVLEIPDDRPTHGRSFAHLLRKPGSPSWEQRSFSEVSAPRLGKSTREKRRLDGLVTPQWWYIAGSDTPEALYDNVRDPRQETNRATSEEAARTQLVVELKAHIEAMKARGTPCAAEAFEISPADRERLRLLGYTE
jgi:arylsulfatase A-like enzyme